MTLAGLLSTSHMLTNTMQLLLENPKVMADVRGDLTLVRPLPEESLRLETDTVFEQPDCLSLKRDNMPRMSLAFGRGPHRCVGAAPALLEGRIAYERLLTRLHDIRLSHGRNDFIHKDSVIMRAMDHVYLEFEAE